MGFDNPFEPPQSAAPPQVAAPEIVTARQAFARGARLMAETPLASILFGLSFFLATLAPISVRGPAMIATGLFIHPFEIEWWTAHERGETPDVGRALSRLPTALAMGIFTGLFTLLGLVLLIVPGIYLTIRFAFVWYFVVLEGHGWSALGASRDLARGRAWVILGIVAPALAFSFVRPAGDLALAAGSALAITIQALDAIVQTWAGAALTVLFVALRPRRKARASASVSALRTPAEPR